MVSSPCTWYSLAGNSVPRDFTLADKLVKRAIEIIEYLQPERWFMENPRAFMRLRPFMKPLEKYATPSAAAGIDARRHL